MVSDHGRVLNSRTGRLLVASDNGHGIWRVWLSHNGKRVNRQISHLVLETFVGLCPPGLEACHFNDVGSDNHLVNLRWDTRSANRIDRLRNGRDHMAKRDTCVNGHEFTAKNTGSRKDNNGRVCRQCVRDKVARYRVKAKVT